ncbi:MAG TPA: AMP-binding protein, partial [Acidimicrobiales bacterium]|nr:AMP-binding protein [Acidimicrobiales bacterium]
MTMDVGAAGPTTANTMLVSDIIRYAAVAEPDARALCFGGRWHTFSEMEARVNRLANGLLAIAEPGARVAILAENLTEYVDAYYGVPLAGMVLTFLNYRLHPREIQGILANSGASVLIVEPQYLDQLEAIGATDGLQQILVTGDGPAPADPRAFLYDDLVGRSATARPQVAHGDDALAWLIYTSGTTGMPKGVMLSHRNLISAVANSVMAWERSSGPTVTLTPWPLCHVA